MLSPNPEKTTSALNSSADELAAESGSVSGQPSSHALRRTLGLRDLVPMQILLVVGLTWAGTAGRQGGTHVAFWLAGIIFLFIPLAAVVGWCAQRWPLEGGVYQWTKYAMGPFAGFMSAWNIGLWALLFLSEVGILMATSLSYALGQSGRWIEGNHTVIAVLTVGLCVLIYAIDVPGFGIGRWVSHFGTAVTLTVTLLLMTLLFIHPHATSAHPHVNPQAPFSLGMPALTLLSVNIFTKIAFGALTGLELVAVFAGETRDPGKAIMRSAWIAAPIIALIYILMTGTMLAYIPAAKMDLTGPIPQVLAVAFGGGSAAPGEIDWGLMLGRGTILVLALALVAQMTVITAETSRLPMVAGWDRLGPEWFTRLHPRWKTPTRSLAVIVLLAIGLGLLVNYGTGAQEAFQILLSAGNISYGIYYLLMFAIPLVAAGREGAAPGFWLKLAAVSGLAITALSMIFMLLPLVDVASRWIFAAKVGGTGLVLNLAGVALYWAGTRRNRRRNARV